MAQIEEGGRMRRVRAIRRCLVASLCVGVGVLIPASIAHSDQFTVANCNADPGARIDAFDRFVAKGMRIRLACGPGETDPRGLVLKNAVTRGRVARAAHSLNSC